MRKSTTLEDRIRVRAYYLWLKGETYGPFEVTAKDHWLCAEQAELAAFHARSIAAKKGAQTRAIRQTATTAQMTARLRADQSAAKH